MLQVGKVRQLEREELFTSLLNASSASSRPGNIQVLKMQHLKTYKIHKMPLAKRHAAQDRGPSLLATQNFCAKYCCTGAASLRDSHMWVNERIFRKQNWRTKDKCRGNIIWPYKTQYFRLCLSYQVRSESLEKEIRKI